VTGIDLLGASMLVALVAITPFGLRGVMAAFTQPALLLAGIGVGVCSSVIPYVTDQLVMARLPRATFALLLSLLPACATLIGVVVLRQIPSGLDVVGVILVVGGVALHQESAAA
jgi:inner membrane transporter RhtA